MAKCVLTSANPIFEELVSLMLDQVPDASEAQRHRDALWCMEKIAERVTRRAKKVNKRLKRKAKKVRNENEKVAV